MTGGGNYGKLLKSLWKYALRLIKDSTIFIKYGKIIRAISENVISKLKKLSEGGTRMPRKSNKFVMEAYENVIFFLEFKLIIT